MTVNPKELRSLRHVRTADVYKAGALAGTLSRSAEGTVVFEYVDAYSGPDVAFTLPQTQRRVESAGGAVPAFFAGLLPEGHRLTVLRRAVKTSLDDELSLLLAIGSDLPGDVQVVPQGTAPKKQEELAVGDPVALDFRALTEGVDAHGIAGVQEKASASMLNVPLNMAGLPAILKIAPKEYPLLVENEMLHLEGAQKLNLPVALARVVHDKNGVAGLISRRFDRGADGERFALEDAAQVMGITPSQKYNVSAEEVTIELAKKTHQPRIAVRALYLQWIYAWLTGNGDLHAKNLSVLQSPEGTWNLSPIYDVPCTALYRDFTLALPVSGKTRKLKLEHWDEFADSIGLPHKAARSANEIALKAAAAVDLRDLPLTGSPLNGALGEISARRFALA